MNERNADVVVVGAGMVGSATACLLARSGFSVVVIDTAQPPPFDENSEPGLRVSALSPGSAAVLNEAGAWRQIEARRHAPYRRMHVEDRDDSTMLEFNAPEFGLERLGTIVENDLVQWTLWQSLQVMGGVEVVCPARVERLSADDGHATVVLDSEDTIQCRLVVGADGADSGVRKLLGIEQKHWEYGQHGLVSVIETRHPNPGVAWQRFMAGGPLAFLPLQDGRSSIVWSRPEAETYRLLALDDEAFLAELQDAAASDRADWPGEMVSCGPRASFPLTMRLSEGYAGPRAVLVGDAAHVVHPLAGQGVNLGLLDAAALVEVLLDARLQQLDYASDKVLGRYARWRRSEAEIMAGGIHGIRGLFTPEVLGPIRKLGLGLVARSWVAREAFIMRAAGKHQNAPALARGKALTELLHPAH